MKDFLAIADNLFGKLVLIMVLIPVLVLGSCALFAAGAGVAIDKAAHSELAQKAVKSHTEHARRERNDRWNQSSTWDDYDNDYGEPRDYDYN